MIGIRTPFRVSFSGGSTDIPAFYKKYGGKVISTSINKYMYHFVHKFDTKQIQIKYSKTELVNKPSEIKHRIVKKMAEEFDLSGLDINSIADIPKGSGLGSSSAFTVGLLNAIYSYHNLSISKFELAQLAADFEINKLGEPIGKQDQYASAIGGLNKFIFNKDGTVEIEKININEATKNYLSACFGLLKIGHTRSASRILKQQSKLIEQDKNTDIGKKILELVDPMVNALKECNIKDVGELLNENWILKSKLSKNVSNPKVDKYISNVLARKGIYGTKLLGAGESGYLLVVGRPETIKLMDDANFLSFKFDDTGSSLMLKDF